MRKTVFVILSSVCVLLASCGITHHDTFLGDVVADTTYTICRNYALTIHPGDKLYIHVDSPNPESVVAFNQETNKIISSNNIDANEQIRRMSAAASRDTTGYGGVEGYIVDQHGVISFPLLGKIVVSGLKHDSLAIMLQQRLLTEGYVDDAVVTVRLMTFRVSVVGEVLHPTEAYAVGNRLTILEALAQAGDVSFYGRRDNICVVRDAGHGASLGIVDLTTTASLESPYYYLQPNDIIYVEPNDRRKHEVYDTETLTEIKRYSSLIQQAADAARKLLEANQRFQEDRKK